MEMLQSTKGRGGGKLEGKSELPNSYWGKQEVQGGGVVETSHQDLKEHDI